MEEYKYSYEEYDKTFHTGDHTEIKYFSHKLIKKRYPNQLFDVIGGIGEGMNQKAGIVQIEGISIDYYRLNFSHKKYKIVGYIHVGNEHFIAIVKNCHVRNILFKLFLLLLAIGIGITTWFFLNKNDLIDGGAVDYTPPVDLNIKTDPDHIMVPGFTTVKMKQNTDKIYMALWNPETNPCYFKYTIKMKSTNKVIYQSQLIPPGKAITTVQLNEKPKKGSYDMSIQIETFSLEDQKTALNGSVVNCTLLVL